MEDLLQDPELEEDIELMLKNIRDKQTDSSSYHSSVGTLIQLIHSKLNSHLDRRKHNHNQTESLYEEDFGSGETFFQSDTLVLICSLIVMILFGFVLRKIFMIVTEIRNSRRKCRSGLRKLAENMEVVTKTLSSNNETSLQTPPQLRRARSENFNVIFKNPTNENSLRKAVLIRMATK